MEEKRPEYLRLPPELARKADKAYLFYKLDLAAWVRGKDALKQEG